MNYKRSQPYPMQINISHDIIACHPIFSFIHSDAAAATVFFSTFIFTSSPVPGRRYSKTLQNVQQEYAIEIKKKSSSLMHDK